VATVVTASVNSELDVLLAGICESLQLTTTQYASAQEKYEAVARWLAAADSPITTLRPQIFPQGSVALQTTVRPRREKEMEEYDLDLVLQVIDDRRGPMRLYADVRDRLAANRTYAPMLEEKKRCLTLNYAGEFHMDILPAVADDAKGGTCIKVPDCKLEEWSPSNPRGYVLWFESRADTMLIKAERAEPLPPNEPAEARQTLKRAVQLLKRRRDVVFGGADDAPRSVVLTTLAANAYAGAADTTDALLGILDGIAATIAATDGVMEVRNPTNEAENFAESWDHASYAAFVTFIHSFRADMHRLIAANGLTAIRERLEAMFGERPTVKAFEVLSRRIEEARRTTTLRVGAGGLLTTSPVNTREVKPNTFFGA
jgi:hypothetical protein